MERRSGAVTRIGCRSPSGCMRERMSSRSALRSNSVGSISSVPASRRLASSRSPTNRFSLSICWEMRRSARAVPASVRCSPTWCSASWACALAAASGVFSSWITSARKTSFASLSNARRRICSPRTNRSQKTRTFAQDLGIYRLEQVIDRAVFVSFEDVCGFTAERRDEDDGDVPGLLPLLDQLRRLEAIEPRHLDVEQDHRERLSQELQERLLTGLCFHQPRAERLQHAFQREEVLGPIVDQQHAGNDAI